MQIHELDNYSGELGNGSFVAVDNGSDTGKLSTAELLAATNSEIINLGNTLNARIDNIIAGGAAPSEAEIVDARLGNDGKVYPSLGAAIRDQFDVVTDEIGLIFDILTVTNGKYINASGVIATSNGFSVSDAIPVSAGDSLEVIAGGYNTSVSIISLCDSDGTNIIPVVKCTQTAAQTYTYDVTADGYVRFSYNNTYGISLKHRTKINNSQLYAVMEKHDNEIETLLDEESIAITKTDNHYINSSGNIVGNANDFFYSDPIQVSMMETIDFYGQGYLTAVSMISAQDIDTGTITPLVISTDSNKNHYVYTAKDDGYIIVSGRISSGYTVTISKRVDAVEVSNTIKASEIEFGNLFSKIVCIGDSLTEGYDATYPESQRVRTISYPLSFKKKSGCDVVNMGNSGATPTTWYAIHSADDFSDYDCAIICLGTNGELASQSDKDNYANIINKLKNDAPQMSIFCLSIPCGTLVGNGHAATINAIIKQIASDNSCYYIDIEPNSLVSADKYRSDGTHYRALGYHLLGIDIYNRINRFVKNNESTFMNQWSPQGR